MKELNGVKVKNKTYYSKEEYLSSYTKSKILCIVVLIIETIVLLMTMVIARSNLPTLLPLLIVLYFIFTTVLILQFKLMIKPEVFNKKIDEANGKDLSEEYNDSKKDECYGHDADYITSKPKEKDYCIKCGTPLKKWDRVCPTCGKKR